jgi:hypothetical protein
MSGTRYSKNENIYIYIYIYIYITCFFSYKYIWIAFVSMLFKKKKNHMFWIHRNVLDNLKSEMEDGSSVMTFHYD